MLVLNLGSDSGGMRRFLSATIGSAYDAWPDVTNLTL
jgi:hypothetical protein